MDVPAVVGCEALYQRAGHHDTIIVDGLSGNFVTLHPNEKQIAIARAKQQRFNNDFSGHPVRTSLRGR